MNDIGVFGNMTIERGKDEFLMKTYAPAILVGIGSLELEYIREKYQGLEMLIGMAATLTFGILSALRKT
jgi:hypothetical protein